VHGPAYMRLSRPPFPIITKDSDEFILGRANVMREGRDITVIACGLMVYEALQAAEILKKENIETRVINMHTIKPIDREIIIKSAQEIGAIVTAEEHQINGGLGSAVAEVLARNFPVPVEMVAVNDTFGESGESEELLQKYHLKDIDIVDAVKRVIARKKKG
ncbi:MAG: transketolase C-terminal domain-containing protein, partial [Thermodesulfovibrionia bacterium]|nr:transketolase C-terminal domain-containing protein [Thermodesulfovibrionia bacterium]